MESFYMGATVSAIFLLVAIAGKLQRIARAIETKKIELTNYSHTDRTQVYLGRDRTVL